MIVAAMNAVIVFFVFIRELPFNGRYQMSIDTDSGFAG
jgi:hypothetical protein